MKSSTGTFAGVPTASWGNGTRRKSTSPRLPRSPRRASWARRSRGPYSASRSVFKRIDWKLPEVIYDKKSFVDRVKDSVPDRILGSSVKDIRSYDGIKIVLIDDSWLLLRPSGTEPKLRIYSETASGKRTEGMLKAGQRLARNYFR